ncbi:MAG: S-layer homology domain-containing protein [Peptococcaceae bacterium]|nr:S-layer homology domain-containing protein [Peptococcaceae bacterium]
MQYQNKGLSNDKSKRKLKVIAAALMLAFLFTMVMPMSAFAAFPDVPSNHWAVQYIDRVAAREIMGGYEDGTARPDNPVTQFEAIVMASKMMGLTYDEKTQKGTYLPFKYPDWPGAYDISVAAYTAGLVDPSDFTHNGAASREWIAKLLIQALEAEAELSTVANDAWYFVDSKDIGSKYANYVKLAYDKELLGGYPDKTFRPKNTVTRAELAVMLSRVENQLEKTAANVVRGEVTAISGVKVTIAGADGKSYGLNAATTSTLYNKAGKKIGVTDLAIGDTVYAVYKSFLLTYLEVQSVQPTVTDQIVSGTIRAIIDEKDTIIVLDEKDELHTIIVDKNTKIAELDDDTALVFEDLQEDMKVSLKVNEKDQIAKEIVIEENADGSKSGTIYNVDVYDKLITMQERAGLRTYEMANNMEVSISGMLTATASSLKEGDKATYTIVNGKMTAIAVGSSSDNYGGNATVKAIDTTNRILNYVNTAGELKSAYYTAGFSVTFKDGQTGTIADVQQGDSIEITVSNNQLSKLTVTNRSVSEGMEVTLYSVDSASDLITVTTSDGSLKSYILADNVKVLLYGESSSLAMLEKGMTIELTLQNNEVTRIQANDMVEGVVKSVNTSSDTIQVTTEDGNVTYDVSDDITVKRYKKTSSYLGIVSVGDTVSMKVENNEVILINIHEQVAMTVIDKTNSSGWIRLADEDGNYTSRYIDDVEMFVDGDYSYKVSDINIGDQVVATFEGSTLVKLEVESHVDGEITDINTTKETLTVRTFSGDVRTVSFTDDTYVLKNGTKYTSIGKLREGDRVLIDPVSGGKKITVMSSKTGEIRFATSSGIQFKNDTYGNLYLVVDNYYCHRDNSTTEKTLSDLSTGGATVTIYYTDQEHVYEIVID